MTTTVLISLYEAAQRIPGATVQTLLRKARADKLTVYKVGKAYATTDSDLERLIESCRVAPKAPGFGLSPPIKDAPPLGLCETEHGSAALDSAIARVKRKKPQL